MQLVQLFIVEYPCKLFYNEIWRNASMIYRNAFKTTLPLLILLVALSTFIPASAQYSVATFEPADCIFAIPDGATVECGFVVVPEDRQGDLTDTIRLYTAVYRSTAATPVSDPVVFLQGGPGGGIVEAIAGQYQALIAPILAERDFVVFDQRGTGLSEPALNCTELTEYSLATIEQLLSDEDSLAGSEEALNACRDRLTSEGVNIPAYTSAENAADIADLASLLGYEQVNLYGGSYGTRLALTVMRDFPTIVRTAVLDGVLPPQINLFNQQGFKSQRSLDLLFADCATDPDCSAAYPDLETVFYDLVAQLDAEPVIVMINNPSDGVAYDVPVNGLGLTSALFFSFQVSSLIPALPETIYAVRDGDTSGLILPLTIPLIIGDNVNLGMFLSVNCHEEVFATTPEALTADNSAYPGVADFALSAIFGSGEAVTAVCQAWGAAPFDPREVEPVVSDIPTLLLNGEYDPATPPDFGVVAQETLSNSYFYEFPSLGHAESVTGGCPLEIALQFLSDPTTEPDSGCIAEMPGVDFDIAGEISGPIEVALIEFSNADFGISGLLPEGWAEVSAGVYARGDSASDQTALIVQAAPMASDELLQLLLGQFGITETPEAAATREANGFSWSLYEVTFQGLQADIALTDADGTALVIVMLSDDSERQALYDAVFLPMIDALVKQ